MENCKIQTNYLKLALTVLKLGSQTLLALVWLLLTKI